jgi:hypothetical protein
MPFATGLAPGRRRPAHRRTVLATSGALTLAAVGLGGATACGPTGDDDRNRPTTAAPQQRSSAADKAGGGHGRVSAERMIELLTSLLPEGDTTREYGDGWAGGDQSRPPSAAVAFDDGKGAGLIRVKVSHVDPDAHRSDRKVSCPDKAFTHYEACTTNTLADGSRYMLLKGYQNRDPDKGTKRWQAVRLTPEGVLVVVDEWNAPAADGLQTTRENPPLSPARMKAVATSKKWLPVGGAQQVRPPLVTHWPGTPPPAGEAIREQLTALLPKDRHFEITGKGADERGSAYVVVDDGKGESLIQATVQTGMGDAVPHGRTSTLPDGTRVGLQERPDGKSDGKVVMWAADVVHPDGSRIVISAFNTGRRHGTATRTEPAVGLADLKKIALDDSWQPLG